MMAAIVGECCTRRHVSSSMAVIRRLVVGKKRYVINRQPLSKHLESLLPLVVDILTESQFPEEEFRNLKNITLQNLKVNQAKTSYLASVGFRQNIFGDSHPYGRSLKENAITEISLNDLKRFYNEFYTYKNCQIILSGNGDQDFYALFNKYFGKNSWGNTSKKSQNYTIQTKTGLTIIEKENNLQSSIRIGRPMFTLAHEDYFKSYILTEVLGGYFGSRLMKNIREEKGYTYGIHANIISHQREGYFVIGTDVNKENTDNTISEIYKEIEILRSEPVPFDELETVKNYMLGSFFNSINTPFALADKFKMIHFNALDYSFYKKYIQTIQTITPEELKEMANKYFNKHQMTEIVAGGQ